jgi:eukaryotic-like serine/threonine-protein kinase
MSGQPPPSASSSPSADALDAAVRLARLRQQMFARVEPPRIAQYHVLRQIGGGGMGLVFAAWDPSLDRVVAIKVLRDPWAPASGDALRREAVALARLRHPNVVSVFEVGEHDGQMYLAMEYVEGETLRAWLQAWSAEPQRDVRRLLEVFIAAAHGLAAAHAAGLVHRDVKPENIMIDADGRVRLMDFGLARSDGRTEPSPTTASSADDGSPATTSSNSRGLVGTPAYMAPEQFDGLAPTAATDQFALCACLYEALYGRRARPSRMDAAAVAAAMPVAFPGDGKVPRRLQTIIARGLALAPAERWPSMAALAEALRRQQRSRWDRWAAPTGLGVAIAGVLAGAVVARSDDALCTGADAQLQGVWDPDRASAIASGSLDAAPSFAADAWSRLVPELDAYRDAWLDAHEGTCEAAQIRGEISTEQMDLRMACLADRRRHLGALVDVISEGGAEALATAEQATAALPSIDACSDVHYVARQGYRTGMPDARAELDDRLARSTALLNAGDPQGARAIAQEAVEAAIASEDGAGLARAELALGKAQESLLESTLAHDMLVRAYASARTHHLGDVAAEAAVVLVRVCAIGLSRFDEGAWWLRIAELDGAELDDVQHTVRRELAAADLLDASGKSRDAVVHAENARERLRETVGSDDRTFASASLELGRLQLLTGDLDRGSELIAEGAATLERALGPEHPANARGQRALAHAARLRADVPTAIEHARRALALAESAVGPDHISLAPYLESLARTLSLAGREAEAIAVLDRAVALSAPQPPHDVLLVHLYSLRGHIYTFIDPKLALAAQERAHDLARAALGEQHRLTVRAMVDKGSLLGQLGRTAEATETLSVALSIGKAVLGAEHPDVVSMHNALALQYERVGDLERSLEHHVAMLELVRRLYGPDAYPLAGAHSNVCTMLFRLERAAEGLPHCRRAVEIGTAAKGASRMTAAELHNSLGGVLTAVGTASEARAEFEAARALWREGLGLGSVEETTATYNLGELAEREGDCATALAYFHEVVAIRTAKHGDDHPSLEGPRASIERCERGVRAK